MKKVLYCASTIAHIEKFHLPYLKMFKKKGYSVWVVANNSSPISYADHVVPLAMKKKMFSFHNIKAIFQTVRLLKKEKFEIISTHTALAAFIVRTAAILLKKQERPKIYNTSHGYLFDDNDGIKKYIFLFVEKILSYVTDVLMVMNREDYCIAAKYKLYKSKLYYINGMGLDSSKFNPLTQAERYIIRKKNTLLEDDFLFVYAAEFSRRKNHLLLIRAFSNVSREFPRMKLLLAGDGELIEDCRTYARELNATNNIIFLGYINDMHSLFSICNACVSTSRIEGLPFNILEAMAHGLPVIASNIKGHRELIDDGLNGYLFELDQQHQFEEKLKKIFFDSLIKQSCRAVNLKKLKDYELSAVLRVVSDIYGVNSF
ncbi:MAG: epsD [Paenibacillaceae bacterium]|nr:epsD [Paenibacillaceae bacterium]